MQATFVTADVLLCGDFNARTGATTYVLDPAMHALRTTTKTHTSVDHTMNARGKVLQCFAMDHYW